jgi:hypothetical protein
MPLLTDKVRRKFRYKRAGVRGFEFETVDLLTPALSSFGEERERIARVDADGKGGYLAAS